VAIFLLLFAFSAMMGGSYGKTLCMVFIATFLVFWPAGIENRLNRKGSLALRILIIVLLIAGVKTVFKSDPKSSIYRSEDSKSELMTIYQELLEDWPAETASRYISTQYGKIHYLECGNPENPPLVMFHAASMGAFSWAENLKPLLENYHLYAIDNIGEGNRSELSDALLFPSNPEEIAKFYNNLLNQLSIDSAVVFGASNGGFIAQVLAYYYPEKVSRMALFGPMGLTPLTSGSIAMMGISTMYPVQFLRDAVAKWALGTAPKCHDKYDEWFNQIMKGTIPSIAHPVTMTEVQKETMDIPILLFLGTEDRIVGDANEAKEMGEMYPDIQIEVLESGHLIAVEHANKVNKTLSDFLN
jgi:pimeloyl-ACP methyl ester carboxylesterase